MPVGDAWAILAEQSKGMLETAIRHDDELELLATDYGYQDIFDPKEFSTEASPEAANEVYLLGSLLSLSS
jgi:hypothetical protein